MQCSKFRASLVNESRLSGIATQLDLGSYLRLGRGEEMTGGRKKPSLLADALEAVVAAVYLDNRSEGSIERTAQVVERLFEEGIPKDSSAFISRDYKSELQELAQKLLSTLCLYELVGAEGPDHEKEFEMAVLINNQEFEAEIRLVIMDRSNPRKLEADDLPSRNVLQFQWKSSDETQTAIRNQLQTSYDLISSGSKNDQQSAVFHHAGGTAFILQSD